ncbi:myeloid leukemia factor isoform X2 [Neodiprion pinetum]|uniref:Myeloid leukemia factor isoform X2 n=1 Tax=Neodiprion lecontei TaxID=441921 RepID=A0A6J0C5N4_NEOLC|nr:myeloid leukemia factor isoform X2 [Neodiprion lecontei]XP_046409454.1 myeloid leukemia factor isoform X2 [Neodiprion fabricii]XP_046491589.1 myeloid leukemia factor isoform X2 [Neodiprion pinetum]XP_046630415.1 myeloid leukemia factor isoform X2 [Neodiprion virginianus]
MSLFGSLMGDFEEDPIIGTHMRSMRHMNNMMNSLFSDPFGMMGGPAPLTGSNHHRVNSRHNEMQMMPFGFPPMPAFNMNRVFADYGNMGPNNGNCHSFMSSSVMTMTSGPDGRPQVYQASSSTRTAPGGVKETKKTVCDSRTGTKKMAIGHHIGERAHIYEREQNVHNGDEEERQEYINLEEEEAEDFNQEWETRTKHAVGAVDHHTHGPAGYAVSRHRNRREHSPLALPAPTASTSRSETTSTETKVTQPPSTSPAGLGSRKRDHSPEKESSHKRLSNSDSTA